MFLQYADNPEGLSAELVGGRRARGDEADGVVADDGVDFVRDGEEGAGAEDRDDG